MNRGEIWSNIKRELLGFKRTGNTARVVDPPPPPAPKLKESLWLVGDCLVSLEISIFQIHHIFNISYFPQFNLSFEKKYLFLKMPKNHPKKFTQNRQTMINEMSIEI